MDHAATMNAVNGNLKDVNISLTIAKHIVALELPAFASKAAFGLESAESGFPSIPVRKPPEPIAMK
jgi:hypothetical protein